MATIDGQSLTWKPMGICTKLFFSESTKPVDLICSIAAPNCKQKDFFIGNRFKKSICLFLKPIVELLLFCLINFIYVSYTNKICLYQQEDLKNMLVDNLLPELKLKQSNILNMGDLILTSKTKTLGFQNLWSTHSVVSKLCLLKSQENMNLC
jgi:hypothetical protein